MYIDDPHREKRGWSAWYAGAAAASFAKNRDQLYIDNWQSAQREKSAWYAAAAAASFAKIGDQRTAATERCASQIETCNSANLELETY